MKLMELACQLSDRLGFGSYSLSGSNKITRCPDAAELLAYAEKRLSPNRHAALESHMVDCDSCRESLFLFVRTSSEEFENVEALDMSMSSELIDRQTEKVLSFISRDEAEQVASEIRRERMKEDRVSRRRSGFFVSQAQLAFAATVVIVASVAVGYIVTNSENPVLEATQEIELATEKNRRINPPLSGGRSYAPNSVTRGDRTNDVHLEIAIDKLKFAEEESAPAEARLVLAQAYLLRDKPRDAERALNILNSISNTEDATPELLSDTGVALYQLKDYPKAIEAYSKALEKRPDFEEALLGRAMANASADFNNAARNDFARFISVTRDEKWKQEAEERMNELQRDGR